MHSEKNIKIIAFVGLAGSGMAVDYMTSNGVPKVSSSELSKIISQISHLVNAGQHVVVTEDIATLGAHKELRHAFPGSVKTVALLAEDHPTTRNDTELMQLADHTIHYDGSAEDLYRKIDELL